MYDNCLDRSVWSPNRPLPRDFFSRDVRQTVMVCLVSRDNGLAVIQPIRDPSQQVWIFPQGEVHHNRSVFAAARHVLRDEIPSVRRDHPHALPRIDWQHAVYAGSALDQEARSGRVKFMHVVLLHTYRETPALTVNEHAGRAADWVFSNDSLAERLQPTWQTNPRKAEIITAAAWMARELDWLH